MFYRLQLEQDAARMAQNSYTPHGVSFIQGRGMLLSGHSLGWHLLAVPWCFILDQIFNHAQARADKRTLSSQSRIAGLHMYKANIS